MKSDIITLELDKEKVVSIIRQLPLDDKIRIFKALEKETWAKRLEDITRKIRQHQTRPLSFREITHICEEVRRQRYERKKSNT